VRRSSLYRTAPWGLRDQPDFVNAVALLETQRTPQELLHALKALEQAFGRMPGPRWGPRSLDLDVLTYDELTIDEKGLTVPHPRLRQRAFVLVPLAEIDPGFAAAAAALGASERAEVVPLGGVKPAKVHWDDVTRRIREVAAACVAAGLTRLRVAEGDLEIEVRRSRLPLLHSAAEATEAPLAEGPPSGNGVVPHPAEPVTLRSDVVGILHFSHPSVAAGSLLGEERELAFVESLGIRNPVSSGGPGRIAEIFVTEGEAVEYAQPLFSIERA